MPSCKSAKTNQLKCQSSRNENLQKFKNEVKKRTSQGKRDRPLILQDAGQVVACRTGLPPRRPKIGHDPHQVLTWCYVLLLTLKFVTTEFLSFRRVSCIYFLFFLKKTSFFFAVNRIHRATCPSLATQNLRRLSGTHGRR